jgi:hypothetical protein
MCHQNRWRQAIDFASKVKIAFFTLRVLTNQGGFVQHFFKESLIYSRFRVAQGCATKIDDGKPLILQAK